MEHLSLHGCAVGYDDSINHVFELENLQSLDLGNCNLAKLSPEIKKLKDLKVLNLGFSDEYSSDNDNSFKKLPPEIGDLNKLQELDLGGCVGLEVLPSEIGKLVQLRSLGISYCKKLTSVPESIKNLKQLRHVLIEGIHMTVLPAMFKNFTNLELLSCKNNKALIDLGEGFGALASLKNLYLDEAVLINRASHVLEQLKDYKGNLHISKRNLSPEDFGRLIRSKLQVSKLFTVY